MKKDPLQEAELIPWNIQLKKYGAAVISGRLNILEELAEPFQQMHQQLVGNEKVSLAIQGVGAGPLSSMPLNVLNKKCREILRRSTKKTSINWSTSR